MFGLPSFGKLMVLAAVLGAVWYGFKMIGRLKQARDAQERQNSKGSTKPARNDFTDMNAPLDLVQCPACRAYIPQGSKCHCGGRE